MRSHWRLTTGILTMVSLAALVLFLMTPVIVLPEALQASEPGTKQDGARPKLVVMVVFDQMRGDYLKKWQPLFCEGGFKRLQQEGAWFSNCHYPYAYTITAPGHASLVTGTSAYKHGVVANDWYDRASAESVTSV